VESELGAKVRLNGKICNEKRRDLKILGGSGLPFGEGHDAT
jgi:hypothetical protein